MTCRIQFCKAGDSWEEGASVVRTFYRLPPSESDSFRHEFLGHNKEPNPERRVVIRKKRLRVQKHEPKLRSLYMFLDN